MCNYFDVSFSTIHRDLTELEREGIIRKIYGGVKLIVRDDIGEESLVRLRVNVELKKKIGAKAIEFVESGECIFIDSSTTCYYFAENLAKSQFKNIAVLTDSNLIPGLFLKNKEITIISTGGILLREFNCFCGSIALETISKLNGSKFFFSVGAISTRGDLSDYPANDSIIKKEQFKKSRERICLIDSSKFNKIRPSKLFNLSEVDRIITDNYCGKETREKFDRAGISLIIA